MLIDASSEELDGLCVDEELDFFIFPQCCVTVTRRSKRQVSAQREGCSVGGPSWESRSVLKLEALS